LGVVITRSFPELQKVVPVNKSKAYRATDVNNVEIEELSQAAAGRRAAVGMDVGKHAVWCVVRWQDGEFERPWKV